MQLTVVLERTSFIYTQRPVPNVLRSIPAKVQVESGDAPQAGGFTCLPTFTTIALSISSSIEVEAEAETEMIPGPHDATPQGPV